MLVRVVVGAPAVVVHLHEVGLGRLVDLRPTDPSLATLAVDRQALGRAGGHGHTPFFFLEYHHLLWERDGMVAMVMRSLLLISLHPHLGKGRDDHGHRSPTSSGKGRIGGHCHTHLSS